MLRIVNSDKEVNLYQAAKDYPRCNYLLVGVHYTKYRELKGRVYAISEEPSTLLELNLLDRELRAKGVKTIIGGDYSDEV